METSRQGSVLPHGKGSHSSCQVCGKRPVISLFTGVAGLELGLSKPEAEDGAAVS